MVFFVDDLSACAESVPTSVLPGGMIAFLNFLRFGYRVLDRIHFIFSWRETDDTRVAFHSLSNKLREMDSLGGFAYPLHRMPDEEIDEWLTSSFSWFRAASPEARAEMVMLSHGLPLVVKHCVEEHTEKLDMDSLANDYREVRQRSYFRLADEVANSRTESFFFKSARPFRQFSPNSIG